jgi:hypothetical protein
MFPGEVDPQANAELGTAGGQDAGAAGYPNRCSGVAPHPENGGPCGFAGPEGEGKFFLERHGQARYHGDRAEMAADKFGRFQRGQVPFSDPWVSQLRRNRGQRGQQEQQEQGEA